MSSDCWNTLRLKLENKYNNYSCFTKYKNKTDRYSRVSNGLKTKSTFVNKCEKCF